MDHRNATGGTVPRRVATPPKYNCKHGYSIDGMESKRAFAIMPDPTHPRTGGDNRLQRIRIRRARTKEEAIAAFKLVYVSYANVPCEAIPLRDDEVDVLTRQWRAA